MSDPTNENAGATPPENPPAGEAPEARAAGDAVAAPTADAAEGQTAGMAAAAPEQQPAAPAPTAAYAAAPAGAPPAPPRQAWHRRRWAVITGAVAAAVILFLGGLAVGTAIGGHDHVGFRDFHDFHGPFPGNGDGFGPQGWGDSQGGQGMVPPGMGQGGQGISPDGGWGRDRDGYGQDYGQPQAPGATPAPLPSQSTSPQALTQ